MNLHIFLPSNYVCKMWDYSKANIKSMQRTTENLSVDEKVNLLNETLRKLFQNYIPNKKIDLTIVSLYE